MASAPGVSNPVVSMFDTSSAKHDLTEIIGLVDPDKAIHLCETSLERDSTLKINQAFWGVMIQSHIGSKPHKALLHHTTRLNEDPLGDNFEKFKRFWEIVKPSLETASNCPEWPTLRIAVCKLINRNFDAAIRKFFSYLKVAEKHRSQPALRYPLAEATVLLDCASFNGSVEAARVLFEGGATLCTTGLFSPDQVPPFEGACKRGDLPMVELMISQVQEGKGLREDYSIETLVDSGMMAACRGKQLEVVKFLVDLKIVSLGEKHFIEVCFKICSAEIDFPELDLHGPNNKEERDDPSEGSGPLLSFLLEHGTNPNAILKDKPILLWLIEQNCRTAIDLLLKDPRTEVNLQGEWVDTLLMAACINGDLETVKLLFDRGLRVENKEEIMKNTVFEGSAELLKFLEKEKGMPFNPQETDGEGKNYLHLLGERYRYKSKCAPWKQKAVKDMITYLKERRVDPTAKDNSGYQPLPVFREDYPSHCVIS